IDGGLLGSELASLLDDSDRAERSEALLAEAERQRSEVEAERDRLRADNARLREALRIVVGAPAAWAVVITDGGDVLPAMPDEIFPDGDEVLCPPLAAGESW